MFSKMVVFKHVFLMFLIDTFANSSKGTCEAGLLLLVKTEYHNIEVLAYYCKGIYHPKT